MSLKPGFSFQVKEYLIQGDWEQSVKKNVCISGRRSKYEDNRPIKDLRQAGYTNVG